MKTALITGGGGAIAEQIALRLEARGYRLVLADVSRARMQSVAAKLQEEPTLVHCDLSTIDGIRTFADLVEGEYPDLDLLVNNAGYIEPGDLSDLSADDVDRHILINLVAPMQITRAAVKNMRARGSGDVLAIVSMGGIIALREVPPTRRPSSGCAGSTHRSSRSSPAAACGSWVSSRVGWTPPCSARRRCTRAARRSTS